jgi:DNA polymerase-3 subunit epsilon
MLTEPIIVLDFETTGLDPRRARLTEVAALRVEHGRITERFETLIHCGVPVPAPIAQLTGISTDMVRAAPEVAEILPALRRFIGGSSVVAHHGSFDQKFYEHALRRCRMRSYSNDFVCTVRVARRVIPGLESYGLQVLAKHCGAHYRSAAHRASADAEVTAAVLLELVKRLQGHGIGAISPDLLRQVMRCSIQRFPRFIGRFATASAPAPLDTPPPPDAPAAQAIRAGAVAGIPVGWIYRSTREPQLDLAVAALLRRTARKG